MNNQSNEDILCWLLNTSHKIHLIRDLAPLLELVTDSFLELTRTHRGFLFLLDPQTGILVQHTARTHTGTSTLDADGQIATIAKNALKGDTTTLTADRNPDSTPTDSSSPADASVKVTICASLSGHHEVLGVLYADSQNSKDEISDRPDRRAYDFFAAHAGAAIANAQIFERATNDPLTGLPNSSSFLLELKHQMRDATEDNPIGILLLDLDSFKRVNDSGGAEAGDRALIDVGATLEEILRADGLTARYGSDKFAILLPRDNAVAIGIRLRDVAERARAAIAAKCYHGIQLSACIGGIGLPHSEATSASDAVAKADDLLRNARSRGKGEVEIA